MTEFRYEKKFNNIHVDACWLCRAGKQDEAEKFLMQKYPHLSRKNVEKALTVGSALNMALWDLSVKCWNKEIEKADFLESILEICPELTRDMVDHVYDTAMFDSM